MLLRDSKTLLCTGPFFFFYPKLPRGLLTDYCVMCPSRRINWMLTEPPMESFVSGEICEFFCHLLACRELVQHWIGVDFAEIAVFDSAEDYIKHTGWVSKKISGFRKAKT